MKYSLSLVAPVLVLTLAATAQTQADPFQYTYTWSVSPDSIAAGNGSVRFTNHDSGVISGETGPSDSEVAVMHPKSWTIFG
jgi:hypothetical protein